MITLRSSHASISAIRIKQCLYKSYTQRKILHEHTPCAFINYLGIKVSSTQVTKSYMHTPHMLPEVKGGFKDLFTTVTDNAK